MEQNVKYDRILEAGKKQFFRHGVRKVTVEDICREANVSRMTFYKFFPNKMELAKTLLINIIDRTEQLFRELMESDMPIAAKMERMVQWKLEYNRSAGMQFVAEIYQTPADSEIAAFLRQITRERLQRFVDGFVRAQEKGLMRKDLKPELLLAIFDKLQDIAGDERVQKAYGNVEEMTRAISNFFIYGISEIR